MRNTIGFLATIMALCAVALFMALVAFAITIHWIDVVLAFYF